MESSSSNLGLPAAAAGQFATTHWSVVLAAREEKSPRAAEALALLCRAYWYPLYSHVRRRGHDHHAAQDLTQEFFTRLLEKQWLNSVAREKGHFRTFLLVSMDHFLANNWREARAAKRGGGAGLVSLDETHLGEERFTREPSTSETPGRAFDKTWAAVVLDQAWQRLRHEFASKGRSGQFEDWKVFLTRPATAQDCEDSGRRLGMSPHAVATAVHRFRERYGWLLRESVGQTVASPGEVDEELRYLFALLNE